jgi:hypothetical protein
VARSEPVPGIFAEENQQRKNAADTNALEAGNTGKLNSSHGSQVLLLFS